MGHRRGYGASGWAPYTQGRWVWVEPWGWTWVDDAPWGFAPSHYGRWALVGDRWCWVPGIFVPSPVYAPALVGFLGGPGDGQYVSGAVGPQVGWFPLAPGEVYWPSYAADPSYVRALNRANVANIDRIELPRAGWLPHRFRIRNSPIAGLLPSSRSTFSRVRPKSTPRYFMFPPPRWNTPR